MSPEQEPEKEIPKEEAPPAVEEAPAVEVVPQRQSSLQEHEKVLYEKLKSDSGFLHKEFAEPKARSGIWDACCGGPPTPSPEIEGIDGEILPEGSQERPIQLEEETAA